MASKSKSSISSTKPKLNKTSSGSKDVGNKHNDFKSSRREFMKNGKLYERLVTSNGVRDILIPNTGKSVATVFFSSGYVKIPGAPAPGQSPECDDENLKKLNTQRKVETKKQTLLQPVVDHRLEQYKRTEKKKHDEILKRAQELRLEDEDEVKTCNSLLLQAQCFTARNDQMREIADLKAIKDDRDRRAIDAYYNEIKDNAKAVAIKRFAKKEKQRALVEGLKDQLAEKALQKQVQDRLKDQEKELYNNSLFQEQIFEINRTKEKLMRQDEINHQIERVNEYTCHLKRLEVLNSMEEDRKIIEYMKKKAEDEAALEAANEERKALAEMNIAKLRADQKRAMDEKALKDEIYSIKLQEDSARAWRKKEEADALKKIQDTIDFKAGIDRHVMSNLVCKTSGIQRERQALMNENKVFEEITKKLKEERLDKLKAIDEHRCEILKQVAQKREAKIAERKEKFKEVVYYRAEEKIRNAVIKDCLKKKLARARSLNVDELSLRSIERKMRLD